MERVKGKDECETVDAIDTGNVGQTRQRRGIVLCNPRRQRGMLEERRQPKTGSNDLASLLVQCLILFGKLCFQ